MSHRLSGLLLIALIFCSTGGAAQSGDNQQVAAGVQSFSQVYQMVKDNYADPVNDDKAIYEGAIPGMLRVLDPHSNFFDPQDYALMLREERGERYGVGLSLTSEGSRVMVASTMPDTPARRAGIRPGDTIVAVNGRSTAGLSTSAVAKMLEGARESKVRVTVNREDSPASLTFVLPRKKLKVPSVYAFLVAARTGYLSITEFDETTASDVKQALRQLGGLDGLILDLRQNPGGLLNVATSVADMFLPRGALIGTLVERSLPPDVYRVQHGNRGKQYPIVVLVDGETASAAEFIAGALQDQDRALVAGQNTFGKSVAQTIFPLSDNTALALTTGKLYLPSGRLIQRAYRGISEIAYYYSRPVNTGRRQPRYTRIGRRVYGGAGIAPDVVLPVTKRNRFEDMLLRHNAIVGFSAEYVAHHRINKHSELNGDMLQDFSDYLRQRQIPYTTNDLTRSYWLRQGIKAEVIATALGLEEGLRVRAENDPEVLSAIRLLPAVARLVSAGR